MRNSILIVPVILSNLICSLASAQNAPSLNDYPKAEVFGGYQISHFGGYQIHHFDPNAIIQGWNASVAYNAKHWLGVAADFSGSYNSGNHAHFYMLGPVLTGRDEWIGDAFLHALFGGATISANGSNQPAFSMGLGGGWDFPYKNIALRLQADWIYLHSDGISNTHNGRFSMGVVYRFRGKS